MADDCACEGRIRPRSALMTTPKATEAMMIAIVDRMRLVVGFMTVEAPLKRSIDWRRAILHRCVRRASGCGLAPHVSETNEPTKCFVVFVTRYEQHRRPLKRSLRHQKVFRFEMRSEAGSRIGLDAPFRAASS